MKKIKIAAIVVGMVVILGIAGRCDYEEAVLVNMPEVTYEYMRPMYSSESEMVDAYVGNEDYWDNKAMGW